MRIPSLKGSRRKTPVRPVFESHLPVANEVRVRTFEVYRRNGDDAITAFRGSSIVSATHPAFGAPLQESPAMAYSRIFGILDLEVSKHLTFAFSIVENLSRPGSMTIRYKDRFRFAVWATNNSAIPLKALEGIITPTALAEFDSTRVSLSHLRPKKTERIATIEAKIVYNPGRGCVRFSKIGTVKVSISADLSRYRFEKSRPLTYVKTA